MTARLESTTIRDLIQHARLPGTGRPVLQLEGGWTVADGLDALASHQLRSAPVVEDGKVLGLFDVRDLVSAMLESFTLAKKPEEIAWSEFEHDLTKLSVRGVSFATKKLREVVNASRADPYATVYETGTLAQVAEEMVAGKLHRVAVLTEKEFLHSIVSLSDIVLFLAEHVKEWSNTIGRIQAQELIDLSVTPISASINAPAIHAFLLMHVNRVSGIAVCDENGALEANLSASDLKDVSYLNTFVPTTFRDLFLPLRSFLLKKASRGNTVHSVPVTVTKTTTLETILLQFAMFGIHRSYLVDDDRKPIGVVTVFDVLRPFLPKK